MVSVEAARKAGEAVELIILDYNIRAVARSENLGGLVVMGGVNVPPPWSR